MNRYAPKRIKADSDAQDPDIGVAQASVMIYLCCMGKAVKTLQGLRAAALLLVLVMEATPVAGEENLITLPLNDAAQVKPRNVTVKAVRYRDSDALEVRQTGPYRGFDTDTFAFVPGLDFHDGTIEVDVAGSSLADAPANARGFIGVAFRIDERGGTFGCEGLYIPAMISTACAVKRRANTNPTSISKSANGPIFESRSQGRTRDCTSVWPSSLH